MGAQGRGKRLGGGKQHVEARVGWGVLETGVIAPVGSQSSVPYEKGQCGERLYLEKEEEDDPGSERDLERC